MSSAGTHPLRRSQTQERGSCSLQIRLQRGTWRTAAAIYFEVVTPSSQPFQPGSRGLIQFVTRHQKCLRVTTIARNFAETGSSFLSVSFDQESSTMTRIAVFLTMTQSNLMSYAIDTHPIPVLSTPSPSN